MGDIYAEPIANEHAVHSLEHGRVEEPHEAKEARKKHYREFILRLSDEDAGNDPRTGGPAPFGSTVSGDASSGPLNRRAARAYRRGISDSGRNPWIPTIASKRFAQP